MTGGVDSDSRSRFPRSFKIGLGFAISLLFLWLSFRDTNLSTIWEYAASASLPILALVLVTKTGALFFASARSSVILRELHNYSFGRVVKSLLVAFVGNAIFPLRAGEVMRVGYLSRHGMGDAPPTSCVAVLVVERLLDTLFLLILLASLVFAGLMDLPTNAVYFGVAAFVVFLSVALWWTANRPEQAVALVSRSSFLATKVERFSVGLSTLARARGLTAAVLATAGYWSFQALSIQIWFRAFNVDLAWYAPFVVIVFIAFGAALPSSPGYVGTYHFFAISGLTLLGVGQEEAVSIATVGHFLAVVPLTIAGLVILAPEFFRKPRHSAAIGHEHLSVHYRKKALPRSFTRRLLRRQQDRIYARFEQAFPPTADQKILDLGVDGSLERSEDYFFEYAYPHREQIVAAGLEEATDFDRCYPTIQYVKVERGEPLPFGDGEFSIVFCSAVIEHVGNRAAQRRFLEEILRVGRCAFITTPNRWYPVDLHTVIPLVHWLPAAIHRPIYRFLGFEFFSKEENLNLLDRSALRGLVSDQDGIEISHHRFLGLPSNLLLTVHR